MGAKPSSNHEPIPSALCRCVVPDRPNGTASPTVRGPRVVLLPSASTPRPFAGQAAGTPRP